MNRITFGIMGLLLSGLVSVCHGVEDVDICKQWQHYLRTHLQDLVKQARGKAAPEAAVDQLEVRLVMSEGAYSVADSSDRIGVKNRRIWKMLGEEKVAVMDTVKFSKGGPVMMEVLFPFYVNGDELQKALHFTFDAHSFFKKIPEEWKLLDEEGVAILALNRRTISHQNLQREKFLDLNWPTQKRLLQRLAKTDSGTDVFHTLDTEDLRLYTHEVNWQRCSTLGRPWLLVAERRAVQIETDESNLLSGRWVGAYSHSGQHLSQGEVKYGGQINVAILQDGAEIQIVAATPEWKTSARGISVNYQFSALSRVEKDSASSDSWFFEGVYLQDKDHLKGTLSGIMGDETVKRSFYLQRYEEPQALSDKSVTLEP